MMQKCLLILFILSVFACNKNEDDFQLLSEKKLSEILVDIHIMDGLASISSIFDNRTDIDSVTIYNSVFQKHNTTREVFDSSIHWYTLHPKKFSKIYDNVFGTLSKLDQNYEDDLALFYAADYDTIWQTHDYITVSDTLEHNTLFEVPIEKPGKYLLDIKIRIMLNDKSEDPKMLAYFVDESKPSKDSIPFACSNILKSNHTQIFMFTATLEDASKKTLKIVVPSVKNTNPFYLKDYQITSIRVLLSDSN